jgi:hypothetical protein
MLGLQTAGKFAHPILQGTGQNRIGGADTHIYRSALLYHSKLNVMTVVACDLHA